MSAICPIVGSVGSSRADSYGSYDQSPAAGLLGRKQCPASEGLFFESLLEVLALAPRASRKVAAEVLFSLCHGLAAEAWFVVFFSEGIQILVAVGTEFLKFENEHPVYELLSRYVFELRQYFVQQFVIPLFPRIGVQDLIGPIPDPTTENVFCVGDASLFEFDLKLLAQLVHFEFIPRCEQSHGDPCLTGACCSTRTVGVIGEIIGDVQVKYMGQVLNVQSASSHISGNEYLQFVPAKLIGHSVPLHLTEVTVKGIGAIGPLAQLIRQFLCVHFGAAEHDAAHIGLGVQETTKGLCPVLGHDQCIFVLDHAVDLIGPAETNLLWIVHEFLYDPLQVWVQGGREQPGITRRRRILEDAIDVFFESKIEHLISFVKDYVRQPI